MFFKVFVLLAAALTAVYSNKIDAQVSVPAGTPFTSSILLDFLVKGHNYRTPSTQMAECSPENEDLFCFVPDVSQKEVQIFAKDVLGANRKLRLTDVNGKHRFFTLSALPTSTDNIQVIDNKINGVLIPVDEFITEGKVVHIENGPPLVVNYNAQCGLTVKENCVRGYLSGVDNLLALYISKVLPEYQYCDCSGSDIGPRRFTLDPRIENRQFIKVDNNQIASPAIAIFSEHFTRCEVRTAPGYAEISLKDDGDCNEDSPGCFTFSGGGGATIVKSKGITTPTVVDFVGVSGRKYHVEYTPTSC